MKKLTLLFILIVTSISFIEAQPSEGLDYVNNKRSKMLKEHLTLWGFSYEWQADDNLKNQIVPSYIEANGFEDSDIEVNIYSPHGFAIMSEKDKTLEAVIWGYKGNFVHKFTFKTIKENNKWYIIPDSNELDYGYFNPWTTVEENIDYDFSEINKKEKFDLSTLPDEDTWLDDYEYEELEGDNEEFEEEEVIEIIDLPLPKSPKNKKEKVIHHFLVAMTEEENIDLFLKRFIAPSYFEITGFDDDEYLVNSYDLHSFEIIERNKNRIVVDIFGENKSWTNRLHFDVTKEKGKWYILPLDKDAEVLNYFNPWIHVDQ